MVRHGKFNKPVSFTVTALNVHSQPLPDYTGTVVFASPTDSWSILPKEDYVKYNLTPVSAADDWAGDLPARPVQLHDRRSRFSHVLWWGHIR